jgi:hypothetical protein
VSLKTTNELTSTDSKKLAAPPSSNQQLEGIRRYHDRNV